MSKKRKVYGTSFKSKVTLEALKERETLSELASKYEVSPNQIKQWKATVVSGMDELFETKRGRKGLEDKDLTARLYQQIGQLQVELDWLKKKSG